MIATNYSCPSCAAPLLERAAKCSYCGALITGISNDSTCPNNVNAYTTTPSDPQTDIYKTYQPSKRGSVNFSKAFPSFITALRKYFTFSGRASVGEFWWSIIMYYVVLFFAAMVTSFVVAAGGGSNDASSGAVSGVIALIDVVLFIPFLALSVRRLHDVRKSGWNLLWALTGFGQIYLLVLVCKPSDAGRNNFGEPTTI